MPLISSKEVGLSFGIELELIICHKQERIWAPDQDTYVSKKEEALMPPAMETPFIQRGSEYSSNMDNLKWAQVEIANIIKTVPGAKFKCSSEGSLSAGPGPELHPSIYLTPNTAWSAKPDASVRDDRVYQPRGWNTTGIEIVSPAMWDCPEAHQHVQDVVTALSRVLRWRVNLRTGFHVHIGAGARKVVESKTGNLEWKLNKFDFKVLQRAAALIWAADHYLCYAHPPERQLNTYSEPISFASQVALGQEPLSVENPERSVEEWEDEWEATHELEFCQLVDRFPNLSIPPRPEFYPNAPANAPSETLRPKLHPESDSSAILFPSARPSQIPDYAYQRFRPYLPDLFSSDRQSYQDRIKAGGVTLEKGIAYIMRPDTRHKVARLLCRAGDETARLNYNFTMYTEDNFRGYNTVEFREATGTLDPTTIAAWSCATLALFRFSAVAADAHFWHTMWNLIDNHKLGLLGKPNHYDMISLMIDCGAAAEAAFFERSLREMGDKHWYNSTTNNRRITPDASLDGSPPQSRTVNSNFESDPVEWPQRSPFPLGTPPNRSNSPTSQTSTPPARPGFLHNRANRAAASAAIGSSLPNLRPTNPRPSRSRQSNIGSGGDRSSGSIPLIIQLDGHDSLLTLRPDTYQPPQRPQRTTTEIPRVHLDGFDDVELNDIVSAVPNPNQEAFISSMDRMMEHLERRCQHYESQIKEFDETWARLQL